MINTNPAVLAKRFVLFVLLGVVLRIITGETGTRDNYYYAIKADFTSLKLLLWIGIGVAGFVLRTFWPVVSRYLVRPGGAVALFGLLTVVVGQTVLGWYEKGQQKFSGLSSDVVNTKQIAPIAKAFFGWLAWVLFIVVVLLVAAAIVTRNRIIGYVAAAAALASVIVLLYSQHLVMSFVKSPDHSWGPRIAVLGYVLLGSAALAAVLSSLDHAQTKRFVNRAFSWRPGFVLLVAAFVLGAYSLAAGTWLLPKSDNWTLRRLRPCVPQGTGPGARWRTSLPVIWLGWALLLGGRGPGPAWAATLRSAYRRARVSARTRDRGDCESDPDAVHHVRCSPTLAAASWPSMLPPGRGRTLGRGRLDGCPARSWRLLVPGLGCHRRIEQGQDACRVSRWRPAYAPVDPTSSDAVGNGWFLAAPGGNGDRSALSSPSPSRLFYIADRHLSDYWSVGTWSPRSASSSSSPSGSTSWSVGQVCSTSAS